MQPTVINMSALRNAEKRYRKSLQTHPDNTSTRLNLAWCLFMQAVHRSGQETVLSNLTEPSTDLLKLIANSGPDRDADALVKEFLSHICIAKNLCVENDDVVEATRLHSLVNLSGLQDAVRRAEEVSLEGIYDLSWEILHGEIDQERD